MTTEAQSDLASPGQAAAGSAEETYVFAASLEQHRYWTLAQLDPESTASNMAISFEIEGVLDPVLVEDAIRALTLRHEALRTIFRLVEGRLSQVILARPLYEFSFADLSQLSEPERSRSLDAQLVAHSHARIDLFHGPVLKTRLVRLAATRHVLAFTMNHIVCDGWSNGILVRDFTVLYEALRDGRDPQLPSLPFQFADFSTWQAEYLQSDAATSALDFWKDHVRRDLPALDMPTDFPRRAGRSFPGHIESALLSPELNQQLIQHCRKTGSTKHIVLLSAFEALCSRLTGQEVFLLGSTIANRTQPGMEDVVGRFANPQILVADLKGDPTFKEQEERVREWETNAYTYQDLPFSRIVEQFQMNQAGAASQFLQVWFLYQKAFMQPQAGSSIQVTPRRSLSGGVDFDMLVSVVERAEGPRLQVEYNTELFSKERIGALIDLYQELLSQTLRAPETRLSAIRLSVEKEGAKPAVTAPAQQLPAQIEVSEMLLALRERVESFGEEIAVTTGSDAGARLSWREFDRQCNALEQVLGSRGVREQSRVVVVLTPTVEAYVASVAALKLGCEVVPLPSHAQQEEVRKIAEMAAATCTLGPGRLLGDRPDGIPYEAFGELTALRIETESAPETKTYPASAGPASWLSVELGKSGEWQLVRVPFAETLDGVRHGARTVQAGAEDSILSLLSPAPQDAWADLLLALMTGARLTLASPPTTAAELQALLDREQVTLVLTAPGALRRPQLMGWKGDRRAGMVLRGGRLSTAALRDALPSARGNWMLLSDPQRGEWLASGNFTPGEPLLFTPLPSSGMSVLDESGQRSPVGVPGVLSIHGGQRTSLLAQEERSGLFRVLDRKQRTVQLHGHRFRLSELEDSLLSDPRVIEAAAGLLELAENGGSKSLVAYVVPANGPDLTGAGLRRQLTGQLPSHLLPHEISIVRSLPRQLDGQIDFALLQQLTVPQENAAAPATQSVDDIEDRLASLWREVLGIRTLDPQATFFEQGGNSLLLVRLFARINKTFGTALPITAIFDAETVPELAASLRRQSEISSLVSVHPQGEELPLFMIHSYLLYQGLSQALGSEQPFYGLRELEKDGELNIEQRAARYVEEIRRTQPVGPYSLAGWCAAGPLTTEVARLLVEQGCELSAVILFDSWLPGYMESLEGKHGQSSVPRVAALKQKIGYKLQKLRGLTTAQRLSFLRSDVSRILRESRDRLFIRHWASLSALSSRFHFQLPQFMYNTTLQTFAALSEFQVRSMPIRITLIRASEARNVEGALPACGWDQVAAHGVNVLWAPGDHETMFVGSNLKKTAELVRTTIGGMSTALPTTPESARIANRAEELLQVGT